MSIATLGDNLIHYEVIGRGEPVIFIHGWIGSWRYWWPSMQALSKRHRTFAFDLWGFGDSSKKDEYKFDDYVEMLDQFIDKLGLLQPATLVGHSLGAAVALKYAREDEKREEHRKRVKRVVAVAMPVQGNAIHERLKDDDSQTIMERVLGASFPELDMEVKKTDKKAINESARYLLSVDFLEDINKCEQPLLLVFGDQDPIIKQPTDNLPDSSKTRAYISLDDCTHFPMLEQAMKFNRLMLDFTHADGDLQEIAPKEHWQRRNR